MPRKFTGQTLFGVDVQDTHPTQQHELGTQVTLGNGDKFVYVKAGTGGLTPTHVADVDYATWVAVNLTGFDGVPIYAITVGAIAEGEYGWLQRSGHVRVLSEESKSAGSFVSASTYYSGPVTGITTTNARSELPGIGVYMADAVTDDTYPAADAYADIYLY